MSIPAVAARPLPVSIFRDDEPVIQSHALLPGAVVPTFGRSDAWDFNGVLRRNANLTESQWRLNFTGELAKPEWNLIARETCMIITNPRHEALTDAGVHLPPEPRDLKTAIRTASALRRLAVWATANGLPPHLGTWRQTDFTRFIASLREEGLKPTSLVSYISVIKHLHEFGPALSLGGPVADPWQGKSAREVAKCPDPGTLSTPAVPPGIWFPLVRAAWVYVHTFAPDVLRAAARYAELQGRMRRFAHGELDTHLETWIADPASRIPLYSSRTAAGSSSGTKAEDVNWSLLSLLAGIDPAGKYFGGRTALKQQRRARIIAAVEAGHATTTGLIDDLAQVARPDGSTGPWHPGLDPQALDRLRPIVRDAAFCLVGTLSMMRDSEIHEIRRGSVVEHYNAPAIASTLDKARPGKPGKHWWIIEPVAEAVTVAEAVSVHIERVFAPLAKSPGAATHGDKMIDIFIAAVNDDRALTGLEEIPAGHVRPHMLRKTMSMLTDQFPGSEIALGIQLKHVAARALANRSTQSYAAADVSWADELQTALDAGRFRRFKELFGMHKDGKPIGYGPGAERVKTVFDGIIATVKATGGDARTENDLLHKARITVRFGMLNNCLYDEANPAGAVCLENAIIPAGHSGPLEDRCRPDKCRNSMIGIEHVAIHDSHRRSQVKLLGMPRLPKPRKEVIQREIERVDAVLAFVREETP
jgi:hypothetical protein